PDQAQADKLFIAAPGAADAVERISPALDAMGQRTFIVGNTPAQANLLKLIGNFLITCVIEGLAEETSFLVGTTGTGKAHLAIAVASTVIRTRVRGRFFNLVDLVNQLEAGLECARNFSDRFQARPSM